MRLIQGEFMLYSRVPVHISNVPSLEKAILHQGDLEGKVQELAKGSTLWSNRFEIIKGHYLEGCELQSGYKSEVNLAVKESERSLEEKIQNNKKRLLQMEMDSAHGDHKRSSHQLRQRGFQDGTAGLDAQSVTLRDEEAAPREELQHDLWDDSSED